MSDKLLSEKMMIIDPIYRISHTEKEIRRQVASSAMQALLTNPSGMNISQYDQIAAEAVCYADALLRELAK